MFFLSSKPSQIITIWFGMGKYPFGGFLTRFPPSCMQDQAKHEEEKKHTSSSALHLSYPIYVPCPDVGDVGMSGFVSKLGTPKPLCFLNSLGPSLRNPNRRSN